MDRDREGIRTSKTQSKLKNPIEKNRIGKRSPSKKGGEAPFESIHLQWKRFLQGLPPEGPLRNVILESWRRSRADGIDPAPSQLSPRRITEDDLQARLDTNRELVDIAALHLDWISSSLAQILHAVFLVDRDGIVLYATGNDSRMRESFHVEPGYDWSERKMGTNAVGTALAGNQAIAVSGPEHFIQLFHHYACTGVPIHANGQVVGAIGIGTPVADGHPERMILTSHTAYVIEQELMHRQTASQAESIKAEAMMLLSNSLDYKTILSIIARLVVPRLADWCIIDMVEENQLIVRCAVAHADPSKSTLAHDLRHQSLNPDVPYGAPRVTRTGRSELYPEISDLAKKEGASDERHFRLIQQMNAISGMVVPIPGRGRVMGAITFISAESGRRYNRVDLALAEDLARRAGLAIENAQLYRAAQEEIAERKRTQEALRRSEERFRQVSESGIVSLAFFDLTGRITDANDAFLKMIDFTREELLEGKVRWDQLTPPEWMERTRQAVQEFKTRGRCTPYEKEYFRKDGTRFWGLFGGAMLESGAEGVAFVVDITERKRAEAALRNSREQLQAILDNTTAVVYLMSIDHRFMMVNRQFERLFDLKKAEVDGKSIDDLFPKEVADAFRANNENVLEAEHALEFEEEVPLVDGVHVYLSMKVPLFDQTGKPYAICGISSDITDRKRMEETLRQKTREAEEASRAKSQFVSIISHELRTPLNAIIGYSGLLKRPEFTERPGKRSEMNDRIYYNAHILLELINNLLNLNRMEAGQMPVEAETVFLADVVGGIVENLRPMGEEKGLKVAFINEDGPLPIHSDSKKIEQIVTNLISNAIKFTDHGAVTVRLSDRSAEQRAVIEVSDTGIGIGEGDLPRLFEPFYQADPSDTRSYEGTGLGLSIVKKFTELLGGTVRVASTLGAGATFTLSLPYERKPPS
ncbi:PAS domain S-box protein [Candidatus Manganitrophus noduliformans]|uniref:histidine kinase n=1 Tax=Candidatus Manganitrophus noduliformans TaxID=2606439 RepID=A0A7X6DRT3_9BACT|nr:PAS domain S-box protein [Candidatus Manganitrophus noduliformans]NKE72211.1 PAS domain S-box protein [Candidatus Manganitrophus noduliformans]